MFRFPLLSRCTNRGKKKKKGYKNGVHRRLREEDIRKKWVKKGTKRSETNSDLVRVTSGSEMTRVSQTSSLIVIISLNFICL